MDPGDQPTLRDGDLLLRPWTTGDVEQYLQLHDAEIARWFDLPPMARAYCEAVQSLGAVKEWVAAARRETEFVAADEPYATR